MLQINMIIPPLFVASQNGYIEIVKYLTEHGADVNKCRENGWTPLHAVSENGHLESVKLLVKNGADINKKQILIKGHLCMSPKSTDIWT